MNHEAYKEMLAREALDLPVDLDQQGESADFRAHLASCTDCQTEMRQLRETAAQLAYTVTPVEAPASVRAALLRRIDIPDIATPARDLSPFANKSNVILFQRRTFAFGAIAASILLAATIIATITLWRRLDRTEERLAQAERVEALLASSDTRIAILRGTAEAPDARARLIINHRTGETILYSFDLPPAEAGQAYQLWYIADGRPLPGGVLMTDAQGHATLRQQAPSDGITADAFAVTIEPTTGSLTPTGAKYLISPAA
jgi:anti-sigma-K factor RskA